MRRALALWLLVAAGIARAGSLGDPDQVDGLELEPKTGRLRLLVILGEDRVNTRPAVKALYRKFNRYQDFIESGEALRAAPNANPALRPVVVLVGPQGASSGEMQNLEGLKLAASKAGAAVEVLPHQPGLAPKPVRNRR